MTSTAIFRRPWPWLTALLLAVPLHAAAVDWYTVELLVFAERGSAGLEEETWSASPGSPDTSGATLPGEGDFQLVPRSELELAGVARQLDRSGRYRTLLLTGWRQPGFGPRRAIPVQVRSDDGGGGLLAAGAGLFGGVDSANQRPSIEGIVRVHRSRFLHVLVDLLYSRPEPATQTTEAVAVGFTPSLFRLTESRRMRSRELHYYDHPLFGVLVKITPYGELLEAEPTEDPTEAADAVEGETAAPAD